MRTAPAFQITIDRFGAWRTALAVPWVAAACALAAWLLAGDWTVPRAAAGAAGVLPLAACTWLARVPSMSLRWDTETWRLGPAARRGEEPWAGTLAVAIDLGPWMLLKFAHDAAVGARRVTWLPVQRRGIEPRWHALRCAVYCARPAQGHAADAARRDPPE
jgi:hypothetical protein